MTDEKKPGDFGSLRYLQQMSPPKNGVAILAGDLPELETFLDSLGTRRWQDERWDGYSVMESRTQPDWISVIRRALDFTHHDLSSPPDTVARTLSVYADAMSETYYVLLVTLEEDFILLLQESDALPQVIAERRHLPLADELLRSVSKVLPGTLRAGAPDPAVEAL